MRDGFLGGVVEGFYGQPWTRAQRLELLDQMSDWGLNSYFYAPKDDLKHRAIWRSRYSENELALLTELIAACHQHQIIFIYGLSPGLDIRFSDPSETDTIKTRCKQLMDVGVQHFALLFDDLPGEMNEADRDSFDSVAAAQCSVANAIFDWLMEANQNSRLLFCPTPYCDRMDRWQLAGQDYLETIGRLLAPRIDVLWTGPEIISQHISVESIQNLSQRIQRSPIIWDNLFANDYDLRRLFCGPFSGRSKELIDSVGGILINPNNEFPINYVPLRTFAMCLSANEEYDPRSAFLRAVAEWAEKYKTVNARVSLEDIILLSDCYYLPHADGQEAERLQELVANLMERPVVSWGDEHARFIELHRRILGIFEALTQLTDRDLFYAWSRRVWELKEELDLIHDFLNWKKSGADGSGMESETHLPKIYRGGTVAQLQSRLVLDENGQYRPGSAIG